MKSVKLLIILLFYLNLIFIQAPPPFNEFDLKYEYYSINNVELTEMKSYMKGKKIINLENCNFVYNNPNKFSHFI